MHTWMARALVSGFVLVLFVAIGTKPILAQNTFPSVGDVGIGTTTPQAALHVTSPGTALRLDAPADGTGFILFPTTSATSGTQGVSSPPLSFSGSGWTGTAAANRLMQFVNVVTDASNYRLSVQDNFGSERMIVRNSGDVGIGTTSPQARLHVVSSGTALRLVAPADGTAFIMLPTTSATSGTQGVSSPPVSLSGSGWTGSAAVNRLMQFVNVVTNASNYRLSVQDNFGFERMVVLNGGNVGIGTTTPAARLHVAGDAQVDGNIAAKYQDVAEWVKTTETVPAGTVVVIDPKEIDVVAPASAAYDTRVAGVVSAEPGIILGQSGENKVKVAHSGRVKVRADAAFGPIAIGDLLVTSGRRGHAMRSTPVDVGGVTIHRPGTIVGKALEPLHSGAGEILVLLTLQ